MPKISVGRIFNSSHLLGTGRCSLFTTTAQSQWREVTRLCGGITKRFRYNLWALIWSLRENASFRIDAEQTLVMGLPPPEIDNIVSGRNYGLAHSIRGVYIQVLVLESAFMLLLIWSLISRQLLPNRGWAQQPYDVNEKSRKSCIPSFRTVWRLSITNRKHWIPEEVEPSRRTHESGTPKFFWYFHNSWLFQ